VLGAFEDGELVGLPMLTGRCSEDFEMADEAVDFVADVAEAAGLAASA